jgi:hypothetical protein
MITDKVKQVIFKKLYNDLKGIEIIPYKNSLFFVDRENKYWYLEFDNDGTLYWRYEFFNIFFSLFSMKYKDYEKIISEWMEEVLNCKVLTTKINILNISLRMEEVLNCKVLTTVSSYKLNSRMMEEVLNYKVNKTELFFNENNITVEEILNHKVNTSIASISSMSDLLEEVLTTEERGNDYAYPHLHYEDFDTEKF